MDEVRGVSILFLVGLLGAGFALHTAMGAPASQSEAAVESISYVAHFRAGASAAICSVSASGGAAARAVRGSGSYEEAAWSSDGKLAALVSRLRGARRALDVMTPSGKKRWRVASEITPPFWADTGVQPQWAPDGSLIAFIMDRSLYVARPDGSGLRLLLNPHLFAGGLRDPSWSPDGSRIFFLKWQLGPVELGLLSIRPDGSDLWGESTSDSSGATLGGVWSPDRTMRAFAFNGAVVVEDADGTHRRQISADSPLRADTPVWSPDGTMIAFLRRPVPQGAQLTPADLYVANVDGSSERRLTATPTVDEESPSWRSGVHTGFGPCGATRELSLTRARRVGRVFRNVA